jgi:ribonuclease VapC
VLDASALLAFIHDEPGADVVENALLKGASISAANLAEVVSKLADSGDDPTDVIEGLRRRGTLTALEIMPLTVEDALAIANLQRRTRAQGLSLGDRACLGLARRLGLPALTADRSWLGLRLAIKVETIR